MAFHLLVSLASPSNQKLNRAGRTQKFTRGAGAQHSTRAVPRPRSALSEDSPEPPTAGGLSAALAAVEDWMDTPHRLRAGADELGAMGLPPVDRPIAIDGASVAWAHGRRSRFSVEGLRRCLDFFADHGYRSVVAFVSLAFTQPPPEGSRRTRIADDVPALLALRAAGRVEVEFETGRHSKRVAMQCRCAVQMCSVYGARVI